LAWIVLFKTNSPNLSSLKNYIDGYLSLIFFREKQQEGKRLKIILSLLGLIFLAYGFYRINKTLSFPGTWAFIPVLGTIMIILAGPDAYFNRTFLSNKIAVSVGLISYPLYLWHWPLLSFARIVNSEIPSPDIIVIIVVVSVLLAWLTYIQVELPIRQAVNNNNINAIPVILVLFMSFILCCAYFIHGGFKFKAQRA